MEEILKNLFESEILTDDTKQQLKETFEQHLKEQVEAAKLEATTAVQTQLVEQWVTERETLIQAIDAKIDQFMEAELHELKTDIENYRNLEVEYAEKLVEAKAAMAMELQTDIAQLLQKIDIFLEERLEAEFNELREDIEIAKKDRFGRQIFEAFSNMYATKFFNEDSVAAQLAEAEELNASLTKQLMEAEQVKDTLTRTATINSLLTPLSGRSRDIMESLLQSSTTSKLNETYQKFIGRLLNESVNPTAEKEGQVLAEGEKQTTKTTIVEENFVVKTGDESAKKASEMLNETTLDPAFRARLRQLSGIDA